MAFGLDDGSGGGSGGEFLGRLNVDVRTGFFKITDRVQNAEGQWESKERRPVPDAGFLFDYGSLEYGWIKIDKQPVFMLAPWGKPAPARPQEMKKNDQTGKDQYSFMPGFRVKTLGTKLYGDDLPRYFSGNSKTLNQTVEKLIQAIENSPEAAEGLVPIVQSRGSEEIHVTTPKGTNTFYAPIFSIERWISRPASLGARLVPPPAGRAAPQARAPKPSVVPLQDDGYTMPLPERGAAPAGQEMPF